jgi:hypothetical protein
MNHAVVISDRDFAATAPHFDIASAVDGFFGFGA